MIWTITAPLGNAHRSPRPATRTSHRKSASALVFAIEPAVGKARPPADAAISAQMGHAVGLSCTTWPSSSMSVCWVKVLHGSVTEGQRVKAGDTLLTFDMTASAQPGYKTITAIIVTNGEDFASVYRHFGMFR